MNGRFSRNFLFNVVGGILPIATALVSVPIYLHLIGPARYGVVSVCWILLGYLGFLDFGLSRASANALGKLGDAGPAVRTPVLVTAFYLNLAMGLVGSVVLYVSGRWILDNFFSIPGDFEGEMAAAFPWIVPMLPLGMVLGVANGALDSRERFLTANVLNTSGTVLGQALPLLAAWLIGPGLDVVIPALLLVRLLVVVASFVVVVQLERPVGRFGLHLGWARRLFGYGAWVSVSSVVAPLLDTFDQVLIGRMLGPVAIAEYAVPMNLSLRSQVFASALARTLFPRMSREDVAVGRATAASATVALIYGFGAVCAPAIILAGPFLQLWVGAEFAGAATPVAELLMVGAWMNGVAFLPFAQLQAQGRPDVTAKVHLLEVVPFVAGLYLLIMAAGLSGAALAWTLRVSADCIALLLLSGCLRGSVLRALPALAGMLLCFGYARVGAPSAAVAVVAAVAAGGLFLVLGVVLEPTLRGFVTRIGALARSVLRRRVVSVVE